MSPEPVDAEQVRGALGADASLEEAEVLYVAPALQDSAVKFWTSDNDEAIARADEHARRTEEALGDEARKATGITGESEPLLALQDALATFPADRVLVFVHDDEEQRYREDDVLGEAERRFGVPVTEARI